METATLARPYARAAFELASEQHALDAWSAQLATAAAISANPRMVAMNNDPRVEPAELAALYRPQDVAADAPFAHFLAVLADNRRLPLLADVAQLFDTLRRESEHKLKVRLRCATAPEPAQTERMTAALKQRYHSDIELDVVVDPDMLGGAVLDIGGLVIDGSMRARLAQLQTALTR
jgi:F-type H+-transporting ATPase subunit delta